MRERKEREEAEVMGIQSLKLTSSPCVLLLSLLSPFSQTCTKLLPNAAVSGNRLRAQHCRMGLWK